jgi:hypothetical protein
MNGRFLVVVVLMLCIVCLSPLAAQPASPQKNPRWSNVSRRVSMNGARRTAHRPGSAPNLLRCGVPPAPNAQARTAAAAGSFSGRKGRPVLTTWQRRRCTSPGSPIPPMYVGARKRRGNRRSITPARSSAGTERLTAFPAGGFNTPL